MRSTSGSETNSVVSQQCLVCTTDNRLTQSERSLDQDQSKLRTISKQQQQQRSRSSSRPEQNNDPESISFLRRSSAPEIDHDSTAEEELVTRREIYTRSLGRNVRRHGYTGASGGGHDTESVRSSDGETEELQRARAHLKETLEGKIEKLKRVEAEKHQNETKVVVHRSDNQHIPAAGKTLDSEAIKQYQNIKQNTAALGNKQQRYSGVFEKSAAKERQQQQQMSANIREHQKIYKQSSFDSLSRNNENATLLRDRHEGQYHEINL